jgi:Tfp pilus assembly protein PilP
MNKREAIAALMLTWLGARGALAQGDAGAGASAGAAAAPDKAAAPAPQKTAPAAAATAPAAAVTAAPPAPAAPVDPAIAAAQRAAALRKKVLRDDDFVENDDVNRDPFHSYLRLFVDKGSVKSHKAPAVFEKLGLEELALIAIVSGDATPYAMFRDPAGLGETVKKGDYISKSSARVTKILSDRVVVELMETNAKGEPHPVEKAILVNPDEAAR